jgi:hypothetical protein
MPRKGRRNRVPEPDTYSTLFEEDYLDEYPYKKLFLNKIQIRNFLLIEFHIRDLSHLFDSDEKEDKILICEGSLFGVMPE